jgi:hypothetical protein
MIGEETIEPIVFYLLVIVVFCVFQTYTFITALRRGNCLCSVSKLFVDVADEVSGVDDDPVAKQVGQNQ